MYKTVKKVFKRIIPQSFLVKNEKLIRQLTYLFYKGSTYKCNICEANLSKFVVLNTGDLLCPKCGSLPRTRRLWNILQPLLKEGTHLLHFSPSRVLFRKLKSLNDLDYFSTDFEDEFLADELLQPNDFEEEEKVTILALSNVLAGKVKYSIAADPDEE